MNDKPLKWADASMFEAVPMDRTDDGKVEPMVHLLWMTEDPLGAIAAACRMYKGIPTYSLNDITDEERWDYAHQVQKTHLQAPLEFVKFHFFIENVDRAFTHQMVRQRTAVFAQESLRFAVKSNMADEVLVPPSVEGSNIIENAYRDHMKEVQAFYNWLIGQGIPAEDARSILPQSVATRLNFCTDLRNLAEHSGNRLCTQVQFIWRDVFNKIVKAIADYSPAGKDLVSLALFKPQCYRMGHCPFQADFDRGCTIRERVEANASIGRPSEQWLHWSEDQSVAPIDPREWMLDPKAAWL